MGEKYREYDAKSLEKLHKVQKNMLEDFIHVCQKHGFPYFVIYGTAIGAVRHEGFIPWDDDIDVAMLREDYNRFCGVFQEELGERYSLLTPEIDKRYACTVTHIQKKGTVFVTEGSKHLKCEQAIFMDIFPLDYVAKEEKKRSCQARKAIFWGRLLFLSGTGKPSIPTKGILGTLYKGICQGIHLILAGLRISPRWIYRQFVKASTRYNTPEERSEYVTSFEYAGCLKDMIRKEDIFPLQTGSFEGIEVCLPKCNHEFLTKIYGEYMQIPPEESRVNHMPLQLDFGEEERI